jgi:hypothetical protein
MIHYLLLGACIALIATSIWNMRDVVSIRNLCQDLRFSESERYRNTAQTIQAMCQDIAGLKRYNAELEADIKFLKDKYDKENKQEGKALKDLEKADKKRDKVCEYGEKIALLLLPRAFGICETW